jgi:hypothetical protein
MEMTPTTVTASFDEVQLGLQNGYQSSAIASHVELSPELLTVFMPMCGLAVICVT